MAYTMKKEWIHQFRSGKLLSIGIVFVIVGILSPALAKLTPALMEMLSSSEGSVTVTIGEVTALDSWVQFFKNIPIALIAFVLVESSIFTKEYMSQVHLYLHLQKVLTDTK